MDKLINWKRIICRFADILSTYSRMLMNGGWFRSFCFGRKLINFDYGTSKGFDEYYEFFNELFLLRFAYDFVWINWLIRNGSDRVCFRDIFRMFLERRVILFSDSFVISNLLDNSSNNKVFMLIGFFGVILSLHNVANFLR